MEWWHYWGLTPAHGTIITLLVYLIFRVRKIRVALDFKNGVDKGKEDDQ